MDWPRWKAFSSKNQCVAKISLSRLRSCWWIFSKVRLQSSKQSEYTNSLLFQLLLFPNRLLIFTHSLRYGGASNANSHDRTRLRNEITDDIQTYIEKRARKLEKLATRPTGLNVTIKHEKNRYATALIPKYPKKDFYVHVADYHPAEVLNQAMEKLEAQLCHHRGRSHNKRPWQSQSEADEQLN